MAQKKAHGPPLKVFKSLGDIAPADIQNFKDGEVIRITSQDGENGEIKTAEIVISKKRGKICKFSVVG